MVELYTKENCPACQQAKTLLISNNIDYVEYRLDRDIMKDDLQRKFPDVTMVPVIVVNGHQVGGNKELQLLIEREQLNLLT